MRSENINMLQDTLHILEEGCYRINGKTVSLKLSREDMQTVHVLLPEDVKEICSRTDFQRIFTLGRCGHGCQNKDSFVVAREQYKKFSYMFRSDSKPVLVLNLANPVNPGGGVRHGANAQEEDLCRKSSLLLALESKEAAKYYEYNKSLHTYMGSDGMIFTPHVEIIRDENGNLLDETVIVAVLTCAAPMVVNGKEGMSETAYQEMVYNRIMGMLKCAAYHGYKNLVLGAWGCGAFGNDAHVMSDLFYKALKEMDYNGMGEKDFFHRVDFAVLDRTARQYNFKEFYRNFAFENFYQDENKKEIDAALKRKEEREAWLDKIRGSMFGGAVGDALGYPIEFWGENEIFSKYGAQGIQEYALDKSSGKALISDDTQMSLFTANGSIDNPLNHSKGCGGIMRVAPLALRYNSCGKLNDLDKEGAEIAAITHGHPLGYMSAAVLVHIINRIVYSKQEMTLKEIVQEAEDTAAEIFSDDSYLGKLIQLIDLAVTLSENHERDLDNIHQLGAGWVAEETLGIAIYCALKYQDDFSAGIRAAVNHSGDSDSTGAVTGNILGALCGYEAIEEKWKQHLELSDVILEMADDLCYGCQMNEYSHYEDPDWIRKYMHMRWRDDTPTEVPKTEFVAVKGDITKNHDVQAIVNAANTTLLGGGGVDGAIHRAAGPELLEECRHLNGCETGRAKITNAYRLPCDYVIHTPGPRWRDGKKKERELLASCYQSCLELAVKNDIRKIAFPSISTGIYHFPLHEAVEIAVRTAKKFVEEHPGEFDVIKWVLFDDKTFEAYKKELERWEALEIVTCAGLE